MSAKYQHTMVAIHPEVCSPNLNPGLRPLQLKIGTPVTPALGNIYTIFGFSVLTAPFCI